MGNPREGESGGGKETHENLKGRNGNLIRKKNTFWRVIGAMASDFLVVVNEKKKKKKIEREKRSRLRQTETLERERWRRERAEGK